MARRPPWPAAGKQRPKPSCACRWAFRSRLFSVRYVQRDTVLVSGRPFGIKMFTEGLMVVGFTDFFRRWQAHQSRSAGLATGDILLSLDGITLTSNEQMGALVQGSGGRPVQLVYQRQGRQYTARLTPQKAFPTAAGTWDFGCGIAPPASAPSPTLMKTRVPSPAWGIPSAMWIPARS